MNHYLVIAGLPARYHDELRSRLGVLERRYRNIVFVSAPLPAYPRATYDNGYAKSLEARLSKALESEKEEAGLLLLYVNPGEQPLTLFERFFRVSVIASISEPAREAKAHHEMAQTLNRWVTEIGEVYAMFRVNVKSIREEVINKKNKTPVLLPPKNFESDSLRYLLFNISTKIMEVSNESQAAAYVADQIAIFNARHSPVQIDASHMKAYANSDGTMFVSPGRDLHAALSDGEGNHQPSCRLEARLRVGHSFHSSFHYDCSFRKKAVKEIPSCHGTFQRPGKTDHVNIAPNDFARKAKKSG